MHMYFCIEFQLTLYESDVRCLQQEKEELILERDETASHINNLKKQINNKTQDTDAIKSLSEENRWVFGNRILFNEILKDVLTVQSLP